MRFAKRVEFPRVDSCRCSNAPHLSVAKLQDSQHIASSQRMRTLTRTDRIILKTLCWTVVLGFIEQSGSYGEAIYHLFRDPPPLGYCGNMVTDTLGMILRIGPPLSAAAVLLLGALWWRGLAGGWSVATAAVLTLICTVALIIFGVYYYRGALAGAYLLSDKVWWMRPVGRWFGI